MRQADGLFYCLAKLYAQAMLLPQFQKRRCQFICKLIHRPNEFFLCSVWKSFVAAKFHKVRFDEHVYVAVHHGTDVGGLVVGAVILYAAVIEYV